LQLNEDKVAQEPSRANYLRDLSVSYNKMGDLQRALGEGNAARQLYEKSLEIDKRLVAQEPGRADYLRGLSVPYNRMGDLERALGEGEAARQFYEKALEIAERLVAQEPERADYQIDLAKSLARLGDSANLQRSLDILTQMRDARQLQPADAPLLEVVRDMLQKAKAADAAE
jgi:tetratricopeptide (TPR) repeat protein